MPHQRTSARSWARVQGASNRRSLVYRLPTVWVDTEAEVTARLKAQLAHLPLIIPGYKQAEKWLRWWQLVKALFRAAHTGAAVAVSRRWADPHYDRSLVQALDAAVAAGYVEEFRSLPGRSTMMSRYLPTNTLLRYKDADPDAFDPALTTRLVVLRRRHSDEEIPFDPDESFPAMVRRRLQKINEVNGMFTILCYRWDHVQDKITNIEVHLRPVLTAVFTGDWKHHGRMYTFGHYGHQGLRKEQRRSILINGGPVVEYDYSGMHPRLLNHLDGIDYQDDPYALWGSETTPEMRLIAKVCVNAAINAASREQAIAACNWAMRTFTDHPDDNGRRKRKEGKALHQAVSLLRAYKKTGLRFNDVYDLAVEKHRRIAHHFGSDAGIRLMNVDAAIALGVMYHFAGQGKPCLGCHDSFIVRRRDRSELLDVMHKFYQRKTGYLPVIRNDS